MPTLLLNLTERLSGPGLDALLTGGWRPVGQQLYTCDYVRTEDDELYGCVQIRLPLAGHQFGRKQRRLLRRNGERFHHRIGPVTEVSRGMREINRKYMTSNPDRSRPDLEFHAGYFPEKRFIDTRQVEVFEGERLVAFSYFDAGQRCLYSKAGIYDPAFRDCRLGIYTMLLEVEWAKENGYAYYHPGYVAADYHIFDYKLRLGQMDYRDCRTGEWAELPDNDMYYPPDPLHLHQAAMFRLAIALRRVGVESRIKEYPSFTARFFYPGTGGGLVDAPLVCQLEDGIPSGRGTLITYDHATATYTMFNPGLSSLTDIKLQPIGPSGVARYPRPVPVEIVLAHAATIEEICAVCRAAS